MPTEKELLQRIRELEEMNSLLRDKLDEIWAVFAPVYEPEEESPGLIQIFKSTCRTESQANRQRERL